MNITFFIGNGFDLNLGLKTGYTDFNNYFIENASEDNFFRKWMLEERSQCTSGILSENSLWSDLELGIGNHLSSITSDMLPKILQDKSILVRDLNEYLSVEQKNSRQKDWTHE